MPATSKSSLTRLLLKTIGAWGTDKLNDPQFMFTLFPLWWGISPTFAPLSDAEKLDVDKSTHQFIETVRAIGSESAVPEEWTSLDGNFAKLILCDQISRNCFRGTEEAFAYGSTALLSCRTILADPEWRNLSCAAHAFLSSAYQHSEDANDHVKNQEVISNAIEKFGAENGMVLELKKHCDDHKSVIDRFGRYPHRNEVLGRESTEEEKAYLSDIESLFNWEKSQLKKSI